jgi:hypothetical protein
VEGVPRWVQKPELSEKVLSKYKPNKTHRISFLKDFGDTYVSANIAGGALYGVVYVECEDYEHKKEVSANIRGKVNAGLLKIEAGGDFEKDVRKAASKSIVKVRIHTLGPKTELPSNIDKMLKLALNFPTWRIKTVNVQLKQ